MIGVYKNFKVQLQELDICSSSGAHLHCKAQPLIPGDQEYGA